MLSISTRKVLFFIVLQTCGNLRDNLYGWNALIVVRQNKVRGILEGV